MRRDGPGAGRRRIAARTRLDFWFDAALLLGYTLAYSYGFTGIGIHEWLGTGPQRRQRGAQLMAGVGEEPPRLLLAGVALLHVGLDPGLASCEQQLVSANQQALTAAVRRYRAAYQKELSKLPALLRTAKAMPTG
jgi:hypothetical protein